MKLFQTLCVLCLVLSVNFMSAQQHFKQGYFITKGGKKTTCLIKDYSWSVCPKRLKFKLTETEDTKTIDVSELKGFGLENLLKYERHNVVVDVAISKGNYIEKGKAPELITEEFMLQVLVEGEATLYRYQTSSNVKFFYKVNDGKTKLLIHRKYMVTSLKSGFDQSFRYQLQQDLKCKNIGILDISQLEFKQKDLVILFTKYNSCKNYSFVDYTKSKKKGKFNLSVRPGINFSRMNAESIGWRGNFSDKQQSFRLGVELEYLLPWNNRNWSVFLESEFRKYDLNTTFFDSYRDRQIKIKFKSIITTVGAKRYFNVYDNKVKLVLSGMAHFDVPMSSKMHTDTWGEYPIHARVYPGGGIGLNIKNKFSIEYRVSGNRLFRHYRPTSAYRNMSIIVGYNVF